MLKSLCFACAALALSAAAVAAPVKYWERPPRKYQFDNQHKIVLAQNGVPSCEVVSADDATPTAKFAAQELSAILGRVIGAPVPVVKTPSGAGKAAIIVGDGKLARELGVNVGPLVRDGFIIRNFGGDKIVIAGRDDPQYVPGARNVPFADQWERATLYGVYTFLKKFAGVNHFFPGELGTVTPKNPNLTVRRWMFSTGPMRWCGSIMRSANWTAKSLTAMPCVPKITGCGFSRCWCPAGMGWHGSNSRNVSAKVIRNILH